MIKTILSFVMAILLLSGKTNGQENKAENDISGIRFSFKAYWSNEFKDNIEIKAALYNDNPDTVYFLTSTCDGIIYSFQYDTSKFMISPRLFCNASFPMVVRIAPHDSYEFNAYFRSRSHEKSIKLGFDFYAISKDFNFKNKNIGELHIYYRPKEQQTIIWAPEEIIHFHED